MYASIFVSIRFEHQLKNFGVNTTELRKPDMHHIFCDWMEDWEVNELMNTSCVLEAKFLKKYKNLVFFDPDNKTTYKVFD